MKIFLKKPFLDQTDYKQTFQPQETGEVDFENLFNLYSKAIQGLTEQQLEKMLENHPIFEIEKTEKEKEIKPHIYAPTTDTKNRNKDNKADRSKVK